MVCVCGASIERQEYGWHRTCACQTTTGYWCELAPLPVDGVAFYQLTGRRVTKRAGLYLYGTLQGAGGGG